MCVVVYGKAKLRKGSRRHVLKKTHIGGVFLKDAQRGMGGGRGEAVIIRLAETKRFSVNDISSKAIYLVKVGRHLKEKHRPAGQSVVILEEGTPLCER